MSLWNQLPGSAGSGGALDTIESVLRNAPGVQQADVTDDNGSVWRTYRDSADLTKLAIGGAGTPIEFRDPNATLTVGRHLAAGTPDEGWRIDLTAPVVAIRLPFLTPARYDAVNALLVPDTSQRGVFLVVGGLTVRLQQLAGADITFSLVSASTTGSPTDKIYDLIRMEPGYAIVGPGKAVGFGFRGAYLDLSDRAGPPGLPAGARTMPDSWQGFFLPEIRLFVQPDGLDGLHVTAAARNLYIGVGASAGITGIFEVEVVNGSILTVDATFLTAKGAIHPDAGGNATVPATSTLIVTTHGGSGSNTVTISPDNAPAVTSDRTSIVTDADGTSITVTVHDATAGLDRTLTVHTSLAAGAGGGGSGSTRTVGISPAIPSAAYRMQVDGVEPAIVSLDPPAPTGATVAWSSPTLRLTGPTDGPSVTVDLSTLTDGTPITGDLVVTVSGAAAQDSDCYFLLDHPTTGEFNPPVGGTPTDREVAWALGPDSTRDNRSPDDGSALATSGTYLAAAQRLRDSIPATTRIDVDGYASYETTTSDQWNKDLSQRRRAAAMTILTQVGFTDVQAGTANGDDAAESHVWPISAVGNPAIAAPGRGSGFWWLARARVQASEPVTVGGAFRAEVSHWADTPPAESTPVRRPPPSCFRRIGVRVELLRSTFIRAEVWGELDVSSASGQVKPGMELPPAANPADGIVDFLARMRITEDRQAWSVEAEVRAHQGDKDGLYQRNRGDGVPDPVIDSVGALAVIAPLTATVSSLSPAAGAAVALVGAGLGATGQIMQTQTITLYGVEVLVSHGIVGATGAVGDPSAGNRISVLFDVETQFMVDLKIIRTTKPIKARYQAIGIAATWGAAGAPFTPTFVFDPDKGYTIDAPDGSIAAAAPLDEILRVFGFKVSRDNPMFIEVQFGIGLEIGILTIDTATVRATFTGGFPDISISRLRATIDVPGTLHGTGEVSISENLIGGAFDITVTPIGVRVAASLFIAKGPDGNVGVLFGGLVELPVPILLGSSGLGIYGFLGGMGVNFQRVMPDTALPALDWAQQHLANNTLFQAPDAWDYAADHYGFAAGLVLGTVDAGFTLNMKGVLIIEVPGPRIGILMLANVLSPNLPGVLGSASGTILAVIDLDFGRGTILVALRVDYDIAGLVSFHVPVTAFFDTHHPSHWFVELGNYDDRVSVKVLGVFDGNGYLAVYGNGADAKTAPVLKAALASTGLTFAVGFHVEAVLMGYKPSGLYLEASGGFDALLSTDPLFVGGILEIGGELRLWIISISAWAKLTVIYRDPGGRLYVHGEAHGKVDFFFFSVEGSVELTIGQDPGNDPGEPAPLVSGVSLIARSTQVTFEGSASSGPVDGSLGKAAENGVGDLPVVPIDVVPLVEFDLGPAAHTASVLGGVVGPWTSQPFNPWVLRGGHWWRYDVTAVRLEGALLPPTSPAPAAWWVHGAEGNGRRVALGLLTWVPVAQPAAVPYGENLVEHVTHVWGDVCTPVAPPTPQLWTFDGQPAGPSTTGWSLTGVPWPDDPGTTRSTPVRTGLRVSESWRVAAAIDPLQGTAPAVVVGGEVPCYDGSRTDPAELEQAWATQGQTDGTGTAGRTALTAAAGQVGLYDAGALLHQQRRGSFPGRVSFGCSGEILRSPAFDADEPAPAADDDVRELVKKAWDVATFRPDPLADAVWFEPADADDGFIDVGVLLLVDRRWVEGGLSVVGRAADGSELHRHEVSGSDLLSSTARPTDQWFDANGPWADAVWRAGHVAARIGAADGMLLVWVYLKGLNPVARRIVIGYDRARAAKQPGLPFYVVGVESVLDSEARRYAWDVAVKTADQTAVSTALAAAGTEPLLTPDTAYAVEVDWVATAVAVSGDQYSPPTGQQPAPTLDGATIGWSRSVTQRFAFRTAAVPAPPSQTDDLTPWVLATVPDRAEDGLFTHAGITVTFSSQRVTALYAAYGKELFVVVRAASGHHPRLADQPDVPTAQVVVDPGSRYLGTEQVYGVQQPWREALGDAVRGKPCIDQTNVDAHDEAPYFLPYVFDPLTEYLLDVHCRPAGTDVDGDIVCRVPFTTGRFVDLADLARYVAPAPIQHRGILAPAALAPLVGDVTGSVLDQAFEDAGLGAPLVPDFPLVQVLWTTDAVPQPVAVVVESNERLARTRNAPRAVPASTADPDPVHHYWAKMPFRWLDVVRSPGAGSAVDRIAVGPGGTRVVVVLTPNQRGTTLDLDLAVTHPDGTSGTRAPLLSLLLAAAPWEEET